MTELEQLLIRIRDGIADSEEFARAKLLLVGDARLPEELHGVLDEEDPDLAAGALLGILGVDDTLGDLLSEAIAAETGHARQPQTAHAPESEASPDFEQVDEAWLPIAAALVDGLRGEAEGFDITGALFGAPAAPLGGFAADFLPVASAVQAEAGHVELAGLLSTLPLSAIWDLPVAAAVRELAGRVEIADAAMELLGQKAEIPVAAAVRSEAGSVDIAAEVLRAVGLADELPAVARAVRAECGRVDIADRVCSGLELGRLAIAAAVRAEAGRVELAEPVMAGLGLGQRLPLAEALRFEAGAVDISDQVMRAIGRSAVAPPRALPEAANSRWEIVAAVLMAATVLFVSLQMTVFEAPAPEGDGLGGAMEFTEMAFASGEEVVVDDLEYDDSLMVYVMQSEDAPLIIWLDETDDGATL